MTVFPAGVPLMMQGKQVELRLERLTEVHGAMLGRLTVPSLNFPLWTLEDAWRGNAKGVSCIPLGTYGCAPHGWEEKSPVKFKRVWEVLSVPNRSAILIHSGNTHEDVEGCILVGMEMKITSNSASVLRSREAVDILRQTLGQNRFTLTVAA